MLSNISVIVKLAILIDCLLCFRGSSVQIWVAIQSQIMYQVPRGDRVLLLMENSTLFTIKDLLCLACGICLYCRLYSEIGSDWYSSDLLLVESFCVIIYAVLGRSVISATM